MKDERKKFHIVLPVCMAVLIIILDILFFVIPDRTSSDTENRNLQQFPKITWNTLTQGRFESQFDDYVADQFPFRDMWIGVETTIARLAGNTLSNGIFLGKDGYLIQQFVMPEEEEYEEILSGFTEIAEAHPEQNLYAVVVPTAVSILKEKLPANALKIAGDEDDFIDRLYQDLEANKIQTIDVRSALTDLKAAGTQVYYRTDHHWTTDAAYTVYKVFADAAELEENEVVYEKLLVSDEFQGTLTASSGFRSAESDAIYIYLPQKDESGEDVIDYTVTNVDSGTKTASVYDTSYLSGRDKYALFLGGNHGELKIQSSASSGKSLLILKDSYANCFIPFLIPDYNTIIVIDPRYYLGDLDQLIGDEGITDILFFYNAETL